MPRLTEADYLALARIHAAIRKRREQRKIAEHQQSQDRDHASEAKLPTSGEAA